MKPETHQCIDCAREIPLRFERCVRCKAINDKASTVVEINLDRCGSCLRIPQDRKCPTCPDLKIPGTGWRVPEQTGYDRDSHYQDMKRRGIIRDREHFNYYFPE